MRINRSNGSLPEESLAEDNNKLLDKYGAFVRQIAQQIHQSLPPGVVDLESLIHSGVVGLLEASQRYDNGRGVAFETYARPRIRGEIMEYLRSLDWVSRSVRWWGRRLANAKSVLTGKLEREALPEELAAELGVTLDRYYEIDRKIDTANLMSLEDVTYSSEESWAKVPVSRSMFSLEDPTLNFESKEFAEQLTAALDGLTERERMIITLYHYEDLTLREIGEIANCSEARICQIHGEGIIKLRQALQIDVDRPIPCERNISKKRRRSGMTEHATREESAVISSLNGHDQKWFKPETYVAKAFVYLWSRAIHRENYKVVEDPIGIVRAMNLPTSHVAIMNQLKHQGAILVVDPEAQPSLYWIFKSREERGHFDSHNLQTRADSTKELVLQESQPPAKPYQNGSVSIVGKTLEERRLALELEKQEIILEYMRNMNKIMAQMFSNEGQT